MEFLSGRLNLEVHGMKPTKQEKLLRNVIEVARVLEVEQLTQERAVS